MRWQGSGPLSAKRHGAVGGRIDVCPIPPSRKAYASDMQWLVPKGVGNPDPDLAPPGAGVHDEAQGLAPEHLGLPRDGRLWGGRPGSDPSISLSRYQLREKQKKAGDDRIPKCVHDSQFRYFHLPHRGKGGRPHVHFVDSVLFVWLLYELFRRLDIRLELRVRMKHLPIRFRFVAASMRHKVNECVAPGGILVGHPVPDNVDTILGHDLGSVAKERFESRPFARRRVINEKLEDAMAISPSQAGRANRKERSGGKGNRGNATNHPSVELPSVGHPRG